MRAEVWKRNRVRSMKDEVAEVVARRIAEVIGTLERHGLHRHSLISGLELALRQEREKDARAPS